MADDDVPTLLDEAPRGHLSHTVQKPAKHGH